MPSVSDDAEAGLLSPPDDSSDLQYKAKSPMIRKAVNLNCITFIKLHPAID